LWVLGRIKLASSTLVSSGIIKWLLDFSEKFVSLAFKIHAFENELNQMTGALRIN